MRCRLVGTSNHNVARYIGFEGELTKNLAGGYTFKMDNGLRIETSEIMPNTLLGDVNNLRSPSVSFTTRSGSVYDFENVEYEKSLDGCLKDKNGSFLGFQRDKNKEYVLRQNLSRANDSFEKTEKLKPMNNFGLNKQGIIGRQ